ncbi:MAG: hypothetical protein ACKVTZ_03655 [Bacteroidia bacterium]
MNKFTFLLLICCFFFACTPKYNFYLVNGGKVPATVVVNNQTFKLLAGDIQLMYLDKGNYQVNAKSEDGKFSKDTLISVDKGGIININHEKFLLWKEFYGDNNLREKYVHDTTLILNNISYIGDFIQYDSTQFYLPQTWDLQIDESFPETKTGWHLSKDKQYDILSKIYRQREFIDEYMSLTKTASPNTQTTKP